MSDIQRTNCKTPESPKRFSSDQDAYSLLLELTNSQDWGSLNIQNKEGKTKEKTTLNKHTEKQLKVNETANTLIEKAHTKWKPNSKEIPINSNRKYTSPIPIPNLHISDSDENDDNDDSPQYLIMNLLSNDVNTPLFKTPPIAVPDICFNSHSQHLRDSDKKKDNISFKSESIVKTSDPFSATVSVPSKTPSIKEPELVSVKSELLPITSIETESIEAEVPSIKEQFVSVKPELLPVKTECVESGPVKEDTKIKGCGIFEVLSNKIFQVNGRHYYAISILGQGGSGKVYQVLEGKTSKLVALKEVSLEKGSTCFQNEIEILSKLCNSDRVVKMYDFEIKEKEKSLLIVLEKGDCDLSSILREARKGKPLSAIQVKYYWSELLLAVAEIHKAGVIHLDLKPANFVQVMGKLKLIDFGIAGAIPEDMTCIVKDAQIGTINYMSPEQLSGTQQNGQFQLRIKSDVWSLGCILYHLLFGVTPFHHIAQLYAKLQAITNPMYQIHFPKIEDPLVLDVLKACLQHNPKKRPTIEELLAHPYLTGS